MGEPATAASDRYALAVVAFELLTGEKPFQAEHFAAQARAHIEDDPPRVSELDPELSERGRRRDRPRHGQGSRRPLGDRRRSSSSGSASRSRRRRGRKARAGHHRDPPARRRATARRRPRGPRARSPRPSARLVGPGTGVLLAAPGRGAAGRRARLPAAEGQRRRQGQPGVEDEHADRDGDREEGDADAHATATATKTETPAPTADGDADAEAAEAEALGPARRRQREPAPGRGVQPQQRRQVRRGAAGRAAGGPEGLPGRRQGQPVRLRAVRARAGPARHRRRRGRRRDAQPAARSATPTTSARPSRSCSRRPRRPRRRAEPRGRRPRRRRRAVHVARAGTARLRPRALDAARGACSSSAPRTASARPTWRPRWPTTATAR